MVETNTYIELSDKIGLNYKDHKDNFPKKKYLYGCKILYITFLRYIKVV